MNFTLKQLEAFIWVADLGSFRKAADRLNTTQPNISSRISGLEQTLGTLLMERDAGSVRLTSKGQELLKLARDVLKSADALMVAADKSSLYDGTLRLGVTEMIVHTWLREFLKTLKESYPSIAVELTVDLSVNLKKQLFSRAIDLAFQNGPFQRSTSGEVDLGVYPWIWVASPSLKLASETGVVVKQLVKHPILTHARDTGPFEQVDSHFSQMPEHAPRLVPSSNLATCLHMTVDGMGVATLPAAMVRRELESGELVEINYDWVPEPMAFLARYDAGKSPHYVSVAAELAGEVAGRFEKSKR